MDRTTSFAALWAAMALSLAACRATALTGPGEPARVPGMDVRLRAEMRAGPITDGYVQTPIGGQPGTTSPKRPTFDEVGAKTAWAPSADLRFAFGHHRVHAGGTWWVLHGDETLQEDLLTHGDPIYPAGTFMSSGTEFLSMWLGYGYALQLGSTPGRLTLTPGAGLYGHAQAYEVSGDGRTSTRDFSSFSPMLDAELIWHPGGRIHVSAELRLVMDDALGLSSPTDGIDAAVRLHLDLWRDANVFFGVGYSRWDHHDEQQVPNDSSFEVAPWFSVGCEFRF
jgi:hypothetical protein